MDILIILFTAYLLPMFTLILVNVIYNYKDAETVGDLFHLYEFITDDNNPKDVMFLFTFIPFFNILALFVTLYIFIEKEVKKSKIPEWFMENIWNRKLKK